MIDLNHALELYTNMISDFNNKEDKRSLQSQALYNKILKLKKEKERERLPD